MTSSGAHAAGIEDYNDAHESVEIEIRQCQYLNNVVGQDHRNTKHRTRPMLGFKSFRTARIVLGGIELVDMLRKGHLRPLQMFAAYSRRRWLRSHC